MACPTPGPACYGSAVLLPALALALVAAADPPAAAPGAARIGPATATLVVTVTGVRSREGALIVAAFTSEEAWPRLDRASAREDVKAPGPSVTVRLEGLRPGRCAVLSIHDRNANGKLDMQWLPWPRPAEPTAASNGAKPHRGPATWADAVFDCPAGVTALTLALGT
jgi:uncharacterized protein (DUF2141 family)